MMDPADPEVADPHLIDELTWEKFIDEDNLEDRNRFSPKFPILYNDMIIYAIPTRESLNGLIALDRFTGEEVWNNYDQLNLEFVWSEPIIADGMMHFVVDQVFTTIDLTDGTVVNHFTWENTNEDLSDDLVIFEDNLYLSVERQNGDIISSEWLVSPANNVSPQSFVRFNQDDRAHFGKPSFHKRANGENLMIYLSCTPTNEIVAYNLSTNQIEWRAEDISEEGLFYGMELDEQRLYIVLGLSMFAYDLDTGEQIWGEKHFINDLVDRVGLLQHEDKIYAVGSEVYLIDKATGNVDWWQQGVVLDEGNRGNASRNKDKPILYNDKIYFGGESSGHLLSVDVNTQAFDYFYIEDEKTVEGIAVPFQPLDFNDSGFAVADDGIMYSFDRYRFIAFEAPVLE